MLNFFKKHFFETIYLGFIVILASLFALNYDAIQASRKKIAEEEHKKTCLNQICKEDVIPKEYISNEEYTVIKVAGRLYVTPRKYHSFNGSFAVIWPEQKSATLKPKEEYSESSTAKKTELDYFRFFLFTELSPPPKYLPVGYRRIEDAQQRGWITMHEVLRPGLERVQISHHYAEEGKIFLSDTPHSWTYIATNLKDFDGLPPTLGCSFDEIGSKGASANFLWKPDILLYVRMKNHLCADWPEIFTKINQILSNIKEIK